MHDYGVVSSDSFIQIARIKIEVLVCLKILPENIAHRFRRNCPVVKAVYTSAIAKQRQPSVFEKPLYKPVILAKLLFGHTFSKLF